MIRFPIGDGKTSISKQKTMYKILVFIDRQDITEMVVFEFKEEETADKFIAMLVGS